MFLDHASIALPAAPEANDLGRAAALRAAEGHLSVLRKWFDVDFSVVDGTTGDHLRRGSDGQCHDWNVLGELCREISRRGQAEVIADASASRVIAIPLPVHEQLPLVAVGVFPYHASSRSTTELVHLSRLLVEKLAAEAKVAKLEQEVESLSLHLSSTYEEISLLYRLTQNLKISSKNEELARLALDWLADVVPVESLAIHLTSVDESGKWSHDARRSPALITRGNCPLDCQSFSAMIEFLGGELGLRPLILNRASTNDPAWPFSGIRELILVPLCEGKNIFGWLAAFNHVEEAELGSVEASLLSSVGAILGIHSGNTELYCQQADFLAGVVRALTSAIDAKDPYTCGHSDRVARVAVRIAAEMGLGQDELNTIYLSGLLHDIGKIGIDDTVLRKPGKLTAEEYEHIKKHAEIGYRILLDLKQIDEVLPVVLHHHEQWDGGGYPHGLAGEAIPLLARIVAVADAFDAMGSDRPYRKGMPEEKLDEIMRGGAGQQWDARVVEAYFSARDDVRQISSRERRSLALDVKQWL